MLPLPVGYYNVLVNDTLSLIRIQHCLLLLLCYILIFLYADLTLFHLIFFIINAGSWYLWLKANKRQTDNTGYWKGVLIWFFLLLSLFYLWKHANYLVTWMILALVLLIVSWWILSTILSTLWLFVMCPTALLPYHIFTPFYLLQITTIAAAVYLRMAGRPPVLPSNHLSYTENFLYMLDSLYVWYFCVWSLIWIKATLLFYI